MRSFYIYLHKKPNGDVFYVGKGFGDRAFSHDNRNLHWQRTVAKHGLEVQIVARCADEQQAFEQERLLIKSFRDSGVNLVNLTNGGEGSSGYRWTYDQKQRRRAAGCSNPMQGKKHSDATKEKIRAKAIGRKPSAETRAKISERMKVREFSDDYRRNLSVATTGRRNPSARPCVVFGIKYDCARHASAALGVNTGTVARKCKAGTNPNFLYI